MKFLIVFFFFLHGSLADINVNDYFDNALKNFLSDVAQSEGHLLPFDQRLFASGFIITGAKLGNFSTLKRVNNAMMSGSSGGPYNVDAVMAFDELVLKAERIDGPKHYIRPNITVRYNKFNLRVSARISGCCLNYVDVSSPTISGVFLDGMSIDDWIKGVELSTSFITKKLESVLHRYFNICKVLASVGYNLSLDYIPPC